MNPPQIHPPPLRNRYAALRHPRNGRTAPPAIGEGTDAPRPSRDGNRHAAVVHGGTDAPPISPRCPQGGGGLGEVGHPQGSRSRNKCAAPGPTKRNKRAACRARNGYAATRPPNEEQMRRRRSDQEEQIRRRRLPRGNRCAVPALRQEGTDAPRSYRAREQIRRSCAGKRNRYAASPTARNGCAAIALVAARVALGATERRNRCAALTRAKRNSYAARLPSSRGTDVPRNKSAAPTLPPPRARAPRCRA
jgi:hypothetical protein